MEEVWKEIIDFEGLYLVSNLGNVKAASKWIENKGRAGTFLAKEKTMKLQISNKGYFSVAFSKNRRTKVFRVHRLVAQVFIPNLLNKPFINHIDGNKLNNEVSNLEWCTHKENMEHAVKIGLHKSPKHDALVLNLESGLFYQTLKDFRQAIGCNKDRLNEKIRRGKLSQYLKIPYASL